MDFGQFSQFWWIFMSVCSFRTDFLFNIKQSHSFFSFSSNFKQKTKWNIAHLNVIFHFCLLWELIDAWHHWRMGSYNPIHIDTSPWWTRCVFVNLEYRFWQWKQSFYYFSEVILHCVPQRSISFIDVSLSVFLLTECNDSIH